MPARSHPRRPLIQHLAAGTTLYIGESIQVEIRGAHRGRVKVAVTAPRHLTVVHSTEPTCQPERLDDAPAAAAASC